MISRPMIRYIVAMISSTYLAWHGYRRKSLSLSGCIAAFGVGFISLAISYRFGLILLLFYYSSTKLTKLKHEIKAKLEENYTEASQRGSLQVLACSLLGVAVAIFYYYLIGEDQNVAFSCVEKGWRSNVGNVLHCCYVAHFATATGDTWASEVGILSRTDPRLITSLFMRKVPAGTNGGMSIPGTVASILGGAFMGLVYFLLSPGYGRMFDWKQQILMIPFGALCGFAGSVIDSLMGATIQATYYSKDRKMVVKEKSSPKDRSIIRICGIDLVSNETVNFLSIAVTMVLAWICCASFFAFFLCSV